VSLGSQLSFMHSFGAYCARDLVLLQGRLHCTVFGGLLLVVTIVYFLRLKLVSFLVLWYRLFQWNLEQNVWNKWSWIQVYAIDSYNEFSVFIYFRKIPKTDCYLCHGHLSVRLICQSVRLICQSVRLIRQSSRLICKSVRLICQSSWLICKSVRLICQSSRLICKSVRLICQSVRLICQSVRMVQLGAPGRIFMQLDIWVFLSKNLSSIHVFMKIWQEWRIFYSKTFLHSW